MKNKKVKPTYHDVRDPNYIPRNSDDSEDEYQEVDTNVEVSKKKHCPQYITPMSLNKIAKLARQHRVIAPKVSDSNTIKKHSKATLSMGELLSSKKGTRQREVSKQKLEKPSCIKRGSKKYLVLVDEDDDEDNDISQGLEDDGNEGYSLRSQGDADQDDAYDDMDLIAFANNHNEIQGDDSHDDTEGEDDALVQDQLQSPELEKAIGLA
ncbi:hypothetical protein Hanom_Chr08g00719051 [Helianthus anomalus]